MDVVVVVIVDDVVVVEVTVTVAAVVVAIVASVVATTAAAPAVGSDCGGKVGLVTTSMVSSNAGFNCSSPSRISGREKRVKMTNTVVKTAAGRNHQRRRVNEERNVDDVDKGFMI